MKKSEIYILAIGAIIESGELYTDQKVDILRVLFEDENLALFTEKQEEENADATV